MTSGRSNVHIGQRDSDVAESNGPGRLALTSAQREAWQHWIFAQLWAAWDDIERELRQLELAELITPKAQEAFRAYCDRTARERGRAKQRQQVLVCVMALASACAAAVAVTVLFGLAGAAMHTNDLLVTGVGVFALGSLALMPMRHPRLVVAIVGGAMVVLAASPAFATGAAGSVPAFGPAPWWFDRIANEPTGMALGVFTAATTAVVALATGGAVALLAARSERIRSTVVIPDVMAFDGLHAIAVAMLDSTTVIAGARRYDLAAEVARAATALENMVNQSRGVKLPGQVIELRRSLRSAADALRNKRVLVATDQADADLLAVCLRNLMAVTVGQIGGLHGAVPAVDAGRPDRRWIRYLRIRLMIISFVALVAAVWTTVHPVVVGTGRVVLIGGLLTVFILLTPDVGLLKRLLYRFLARFVERPAEQLDDRETEAP
jgi:hypothetical protein